MTVTLTPLASSKPWKVVARQVPQHFVVAPQKSQALLASARVLSRACWPLKASEQYQLYRPQARARAAQVPLVKRTDLQNL